MIGWSVVVEGVGVVMGVGPAVGVLVKIGGGLGFSGQGVGRGYPRILRSGHMRGYFGVIWGVGVLGVPVQDTGVAGEGVGVSPRCAMASRGLGGRPSPARCSAMRGSFEALKDAVGRY
eukprot:727059-Hanusia_phi.AAC.1